MRLKCMVTVFAMQATLGVVLNLCSAHAQGANNAYPKMAPIDQYLMPDKNAEIALARSAAPSSISDAAEVMVLGRDGFTVARAGSNGFVCMVQRSWSAATTDPVFWNQHIRGPICFNPQAAKTNVPTTVLRAKLVLAGKSKEEIARAVAAAVKAGTIPPIEPGATCYMMSRQQYLNDEAKNWRPHLMFFVPGDVEKSTGADLPGSPVFAASVPEERETILMVGVGKWSDGTPAPAAH